MKIKAKVEIIVEVEPYGCDNKSNVDFIKSQSVLAIQEYLKILEGVTVTQLKTISIEA